MRDRDLPIEQDPRNGTAVGDDVGELIESAGPRDPVPEAHLAAIESAARMAWDRQLRQRQAAQTPWLPRPMVMALAASVAFTVGLAGWWLWRGATGAPPVARIASLSGEVSVGSSDSERVAEVGDEIAAGGELLTADGRVALRLTGSVEVRVDRGSRLRLAEPGVVELDRGAVYIDTGEGETGDAGARAASSPAGGPRITVRTPYGSATDIGTRFSVRVLAAASAPGDAGGAAGADRGLEVRVRDGAVLTTQDGRTWRTDAGAGLFLHPDGTAEPREVDPWGEEWDWVLATAPAFELEGRTLGELLDWVARETGWTIELADSERADAWRAIVLHGSVGAAGAEAARPDRVLFSVLPGAGLEGERVGGEQGDRLVIRTAG